MSFLRVSLLVFAVSLLFFSVQSARVSSSSSYTQNEHNAGNSIDSCNQERIDFDNARKNLNLSDFGNLTVCYDMCLDYTKCLDNIKLSGQMSDLFSLLIKFSSGMLKLSCSLLEFKVGPFNQCLAKTGFDVKTLRNTVIEQETLNCELTDEEFGDLEAMVGQRCDKEAWDDMAKNKERVRQILC